ncbi:Lrp/AsnC family transcriptional regulator [Saccharopolyspora sp. ASAGF58]|uniref:Lrp/AsnC family transcriptional regulator n=1 Tax=Saccharopolyspora sp. ASAGF58 TaxID=2719023 RepID=UPI00143FCF73|nr:Lrp/AsnC family transcriptional regulator [Saccharopolyspora sp. ASAGF58]QIZ36537.1 Lrp/AsnC family transcriptional regulator [Saccharopolyspora sp. ASAGF58]
MANRDSAAGDRERNDMTEFVLGDSRKADLDAIDLRLLNLLADDARASQRKIARELRISAPTVGERIARLEREGVIRGYRAEVDWGALGFPMQVFASIIAASNQATVLKALHEIREVEQVSVVTGSMDLLARLRVRDPTHLRKVLLEAIWQIPGVVRVETLVSLAETTHKDYLQGMIGVLQGDQES